MYWDRQKLAAQLSSSLLGQAVQYVNDRRNGPPITVQISAPPPPAPLLQPGSAGRSVG
jgi:hypothetical protein